MCLKKRRIVPFKFLLLSTIMHPLSSHSTRVPSRSVFVRLFISRFNFTSCFTIVDYLRSRSAAVLKRKTRETSSHRVPEILVQNPKSSANSSSNLKEFRK
ncbi:hypothetical protein Mp_1g05610 [Marchantia polymorpha subsp. ruderalis]|uniref:Secreted protein n=2 Tax=Marchantia polymorpha TaxID=3197 RepID=A0AAF6ALV8_MARPO|nr:hypothetical protein MARPO_0005s0046 [Marchantia polymorpha]BBM97428.1 hypothetical protein Mp_1g05610 [Marchantia polymorpha subsp. ruderalis]|eukprot:PTQ48375.1 hypothetical protein MARPO_0005s0046 [Marchantia polymorpha]